VGNDAPEIMNPYILKKLFYLMVGLTITISVMRDSFGGGLETSFQLSPKNVVERFCELDAKGLRLSSDTRREIDKLLAWGEEEGYDEMVVIKAFKVNKEEIRKSSATVSVEYHLLGLTDSFEFTGVSDKIRVVNFRLERKDGLWKIKDPIIAPHVNWRNAINHLRLLQRDEPSRKKQLEGII